MALMGALGCAWVMAGGAVAQTYPVKPVRIVVPTSPGGGNDFIARLVAQKLGERLGQQFLVENRAGAGGTIGTAFAAKAAPDGYTLLLGFVGQLAMSPHAEKLSYDPLRDFTGVSLLASSYHVLAVHPSLPVRTVSQLVALAKKRPGELNYASGNIWTPTHLVPELFKSVTGTDIVAIQYKGSGPAAVGVLSGEAQVIFGSITALAPYMRTKRLAALAVTSPKRSPIAPEVPTLVELGVKGVEAPSWYSIVAPSGVLPELIGRLHEEIVRINEMQDYRALLDKQGLEPQTTTPAEFAKFLKAEYDKWGKVIRALKLN
jgi:tripartite-type tricarboxylate transporter receptor subunit TctC